MKTGKQIWLLLLLTAIACENTIAQFPVDIYCGLPSNHVYSTKRDRLGYLWITTPKGVVKYNGYQCKTLFHGDTWELFEDKKGRMWLSNFGNDIGYIYHDAYRKVYSPNRNAMYYPIDFTDYRNGVYFVSAYNYRYLCFERNDTITAFDLPELMQKQLGILHPGLSDVVPFVMDNGKVIVRELSSLYQVSFINGKPTIKLSGKMHSDLKDKALTVNPRRAGHWREYYMDFSPRNTDISFASIKTFRQTNINLSNDTNEYLYTITSNDNSRMYCATNKKTYVLDTDLQLVQVYSNKQLLNDESGLNSQVSYFYKDDFWGTCISSLNKGVIVNNKTNHFNKAPETDLARYHSLGRAATGEQYLWNEAEKKMHFMNAGRQKQRFMPFLRNPQKVIPYDSATSLILTYDYLYWQSNSSTTDAFKNKSVLRITENGTLRVDTILGCRYLCVANDKSVYLISRSHGLSHVIFYGDTIIHTIINNSRYNGLTYDSKRNVLFAYNDKNILVYNCGLNNGHLLDQDSLARLQIKSINDLLVDNTSGTILVKDEEKICVYNATDRTCGRLFPNVELSNSYAIIEGNLLILAGKFGVLFSKITGPGQFSAPVIYYNVKNTNYYEVNDIYIANGHLFVGTDKGLYTVDLPNENDFRKTPDTIPYKFIAMYNDTISNISNGDTLFIHNNTATVKFDVINPLGAGALRFLYGINNSAGELQPLNANEINFSNIVPGAFYSLSLQAADDVWQSNKLHIMVYVIPQWWQTSFGKKILWLSGILIAMAITFTTMFMTRRFIVKKNARRNRLLELELKAIYAQINPHFIFNTLNSGLLFIKKKDTDEAYRHLFKFSKLLRSYLKSARTRYITLAEEIVNLQDYIELQQSRFEGVFTYAIKLNEAEDAGNITIPSLLLQPIVENAINHGLLPKESGGHLNIEFEINDRHLICRIEDNGIGYNKSRLNTGKSDLKKESYGGKLVKELVNVFNEYEKINIKVEYIEKKEPLTGTIVVLTINYYHGKVYKHHNR